MVKVFALIPKRPDVSDEFFHEHWAGPHADHAERITTIRRYVQSHRVGVEVPVLPPAIYDGIAEVWFDDAATAAGMGEDPNYVNYAHADEPNFIDTDRLTFLTGTEHWLAPAPPDAPAAATKAMLLLRRAPGISPAAFAERLREPSGEIPGAEHVCVTIAIPESYADGGEPPFDAVLEVAYRNQGDLATSGADLLRLVDERLAGALDTTASSALVARELRVRWPETAVR